MPLTTDVAIEGRDGEGNPVTRKFRVGLIRADIGSWILMLMRTNQMTEENYLKAQGYGFDQCFLIKEQAGNMPIKIYEQGGRGWLVPEITYDSTTAYLLWEEVVKFNYGPFLQKLV